MAFVHAKLTILAGETPAKFKARCADFLIYSDFPHALAEAPAAVACLTLMGDRKLRKDINWGSAQGDQLPDETCYITSYTADESKNEGFTADEIQVRKAPVNPEFYPRLVQRLSFEDLCVAVRIKRVEGEGGEKHCIYLLDGREIGSGTDNELRALLDIHKAAVEGALQGHAPVNLAEIDFTSVLPSKQALISHPDISRRYPEAVILAKTDTLWHRGWAELAESEGWQMASVDGELQVMAIESLEQLSNDAEAWKLIADGTRPHHLMARTILATRSPFEFHRVMHCAYGQEENVERENFEKCSP